MMQSYVVIISIGPVQEFIAAARRSRDLWCGSWLLSELSKSCAISLHQQGAQLIFPTIAAGGTLVENDKTSVANKVQAIVKAKNTAELQGAIQKAKQAVQARFGCEAELARQALYTEQNPVNSQNLNHQAKDIDQTIRSDIWQQQLTDYVEVQSVWAKINTTELNTTQQQSYITAQKMAANLLTARKATRDFDTNCSEPYLTSHMIPKSSLDGMRETVLSKTLPTELRRTLSLKKTEQLDCVGVIKRVGFAEEAKKFTPFTRVTAHAWISTFDQDDQQVAQLKKLYKKLVELKLATRVQGNQGIYADFPYDAEFLYLSRIDAALRDYAQQSDIMAALNQLKQHLQQNIYPKYDQPIYYGVLLQADGDRMGELLDRAENDQQHQAISTALSQFARGVPELMREYHGHCIYAGGDDILGFVPLEQAYACAKKLSQFFAETINNASIQIDLTVQASPSLSVGLAICHILTPMNIIREYAKKAESIAKGEHCEQVDERRNALGIVLLQRSGKSTQLRLSWADTLAHQQFEIWVTSYLAKNATLPSRIAHDTLALDLKLKRLFQRTQQNSEQTREIAKDQIDAEYKLLLSKLRLVSGSCISVELLKALSERAEHIGLAALSAELIAARWFAAKVQKDLGSE